MTERLQYLEYFLDCVDFVCAGKKGYISENRKLVEMYQPSFYGILQKHLRNSDPRVRTETIQLLTSLKERQAMDDIKELRMKDGNENVSSTCLGYLTSMREDDSLIPDLMDVLKHRDGNEFRNAAYKIRSVGRAEDVPELRRIYGQVDGEMRESIRLALESIIDRNESLIPKKRLLLSVPIFPDEKKFMKFVENTTVYLDIRYRDNILDNDSISVDTYNNVATALRKIQLRLFNEKDNLIYYSDEAKEGYDTVEELFLWASDDLRSKEVKTAGNRGKAPDCPLCGSTMVSEKEGWKCPLCGNKG